MGEGPNDRGLSRRHIRSAVEASLRRLQTEYIDLYQMHRYDPATPLDETLQTLDTLVREGKIRYYGTSTFASWQMADAQWQAQVAWLGGTRCANRLPTICWIRRLENDRAGFLSAVGLGIDRVVATRGRAA